MNEKKFIALCKQAVVDYINDIDGRGEITVDDVSIVWFNKTLQNCKAMFVALPIFGIYFECTYNGDEEELYFDAYKKEYNKIIPVNE